MDRERRDDFTAYVVARWAHLVTSARFLGCSPEEAEDLAQETLVRCYRAWRSVARAAHRDAYVYRVLVNGFTRSRRRRWHGEIPTEALPEPPIPDLSDPSSVAADRRDLASALAPLSEAHRTVLVLRFVADLSEAETAAVLGVPPGTVKSRVARALAAIDRSSLIEEETR